MTITRDATISPDHIIQTGLAFWSSKTLLSAIELGLFTELAERPGTVEDLEARLRLHPRSSRDFLDALVALGFLDRSDGLYRNTLATDAFLDRTKPTYIGGMLEMCNARLFGFWNHLTEALRTGEPQNEIRSGGDSLFTALYADPARLKVFLEAMTGLSRSANLAIAKKFSLGAIRQFRGCGDGAGRPRRAGGAWTQPPLRHRLRPAGRTTNLRGVRGGAGRRGAPPFRAGRLLRRPAPEG